MLLKNGRHNIRYEVGEMRGQYVQNKRRRKAKKVKREIFLFPQNLHPNKVSAHTHVKLPSEAEVEECEQA
jgi:hypothetical protein